MSTEKIYQFKLLLQSEDELQTLLELADPSGAIGRFTAPNIRTLFAKAASETEATAKVDAYVSKTLFKDIEDNKLLS